MDREFIQYLVSKVNTEVLHMQEDTALGKCKDFGEYKYACGIIRGLMMANALFADTVQEAENDDE